MHLRKSTLRSFSKSILACTLALTLSTSHASRYIGNDLPDLGTAAVNTFSLEKEIIYGDAYMRAIRSSAPVLEDPVMNQYITELGNKLVANATGVKTPFYFFLLNNNEINAFAFFGGHVGIHTGLFLAADTESELASVLAHEITHVTQRHLARSIEAQSNAAPATVVGMLGAILLTVAAPQVGFAAMATTQALATQSKINYTRLHEKEADRIGTQTLVEAGFDPEGAADFFAKLATRYRYTTKPPQMLLTHPLPESRITEARNRANQYPHRFIPDNLNFHLAKARAQVRYSNFSDVAALSLFDSQLKRKNYQFEQAALYGRALALLKLERLDEADEIIDSLLKQDDENLFYLDTKTDILVAKQQYTQAIKMLEHQLNLKPNSLVISANLANTYIEANQATKAIPLLEELIFLNRKNRLAYQLLFDAYSKLENKAMQHYSKAEIMALNADYKGAIDQLNFAYRYSKGDQLQLARIEARIRQFKRAEKAIEALK